MAAVARSVDFAVETIFTARASGESRLAGYRSARREGTCSATTRGARRRYGADSDDHQDLDYDLGVSLHEWTTRWSQIEDDRDDEPGEALRDVTQLLAEMGEAAARPHRPVVRTRDRSSIRALEALRDLVARFEDDDPVDDDEFDDAFLNAREMFDLLVGDRDAAAGP